MKLIPTLLLTLLPLWLVGCNVVGSPSLTGKWINDENETRLTFGPGDVFRIDFTNGDNQSVNGLVRIQGREITFINQGGSGTIAASSSPGSYLYQVDGDLLAFAKISDPVPQRSKLLSGTWVKIKATE